MPQLIFPQQQTQLDLPQQGRSNFSNNALSMIMKIRDEERADKLLREKKVEALKQQEQTVQQNMIFSKYMDPSEDKKDVLKDIMDLARDGTVGPTGAPLVTPGDVSMLVDQDNKARKQNAEANLARTKSVEAREKFDRNKRVEKEDRIGRLLNVTLPEGATSVDEKKYEAVRKILEREGSGGEGLLPEPGEDGQDLSKIVGELKAKNKLNKLYLAQEKAVKGVTPLGKYDEEIETARINGATNQEMQKLIARRDTEVKIRENIASGKFKPVTNNNIYMNKPGALEAANRRKLVGDIIQSHDIMSSLEDVQELEPHLEDLLSYMGRAKTAFTSFASKAGVKGLDKDERYQRAVQLTGRVARVFNLFRRLITGAAAPEQELRRLERQILNETMDPAQFAIQLKDLMRRTRKATRLHWKILSEGKVKPEYKWNQKANGGEGAYEAQNEEYLGRMSKLHEESENPTQKTLDTDLGNRLILLNEQMDPNLSDDDKHRRRAATLLAEGYFGDDRVEAEKQADAYLDSQGISR